MWYVSHLGAKKPSVRPAQSLYHPVNPPVGMTMIPSYGWGDIEASKETRFPGVVHES